MGAAVAQHTGAELGGLIWASMARRVMRRPPEQTSPRHLKFPLTPAEKEIRMDFETLMQANLDQVFGERDPTRRMAAIRRIYHANAELHEVQRSVQGYEPISQAVEQLLAHLPPTFEFTAIRPAIGHNGVGRLQWRAGPPGGPVVVTGTDVAHIDDGLIRALHVFLDQPDA
jgi:hypothetical protein